MVTYAFRKMNRKKMYQNDIPARYLPDINELNGVIDYRSVLEILAFLYSNEFLLLFVIFLGYRLLRLKK